MTKTVAILGGGVIGGGWAARFLLNGWHVRVFDPDPEAKRKVDAVLANARFALPMLYDRAMPNEGTLTFHDTISGAVADADWIQESVPERLALKRKVYQTLQEHCRADAIIGSSTSGFKPSELQGCATRPEQIIVTHPFNPVYLLPVIEVVGTPKNSPEMLDRAHAILTEIGMSPQRIAKEIDAHVADRLLEAVWRESLWLVKDGIATTEEIDNIIRYGFGLRWAQMGLFETYRIAGGEAGMKHFLDQFGPCLEWPWTKLTDVPEFTDELVDLIAGQSDAQSGHMTIRDLERLRDANLVGMMRALKARDAAAGALLNRHEGPLGQCPSHDDGRLITVDRTVPIDWTDYNGHMNESRFGQAISDAADAVMAHIGADADYVAAGNSFFTVETNIRYLNEALAGETIRVLTQVLVGAGKKMRLAHQIIKADGSIMAEATQMLLHVSLDTRKSCPPLPHVATALGVLADAHANLPSQDGT